MLTQYDVDMERDTRRQQALAGAISAWSDIEKANQTKRKEALKLQSDMKAQGYEVSAEDAQKYIEGPKEPGILDKAKAFVLGQKQPEAEAPVNIYANRTQEWKDAQAKEAEARTYARNKEDEATKFERNYKLDDQDLRRKEMGLKYRQNELENQKTMAEIEALKAKNNPAPQQALAEKAIKLSGEEKNKVGSIASGFKALSSMREALKDGYTPSRIDSETPLIGSFVSDDPFTENRRIMSEVVGRLQSGGVIGKEELNTFNAMGPRPGDDAAAIERKLAQQEAFLANKLNAYGIGKDQLGTMGFNVAPTYTSKRKSGISNNAAAGDIKKQLKTMTKEQKIQMLRGK